MTQERSAVLQGLVGAALLAWLTYLLRPILTPFVAAAILAYLCAPLANWLSARTPRAVAALTVMLLLFGAIVSFMLLLVPVVQREVAMFTARLPVLVESLRIRLIPILQQYMPLVAQWDGEALRNMLTLQWQQSAGNVADKMLPWLGGGSAALLNLLMNVVLLPVVLFYLLRDWPVILERIEELVPHRWNRLVSQLATEADAVLSEFLRGQIVVMLVMSAFYMVGLWIAGLQFSLPIGLIAGLLVFIPYVGMITGLVLATIAAATQFTSFGSMLLVWAVFGAGQLLEGMVITPRLVGERIGLHPLAVIFALLAFGQMFGFFGVLLALPVSAVLLVGLRHARNHYLSSPLYRE
ncbi:MAG TPA: AI-2E family transporter [Gallionellaceae bacterium]